MKTPESMTELAEGVRRGVERNTFRGEKVVPTEIREAIRRIIISFQPHAKHTFENVWKSLRFVKDERHWEQAHDSLENHVFRDMERVLRWLDQLP